MSQLESESGQGRVMLFEQELEWSVFEDNEPVLSTQFRKYYLVLVVAGHVDLEVMTFVSCCLVLAGQS